MIVTIDGPAGAGKSSAARALAKRLGFDFLDTGAMYRAVALARQRAGVRLSDEAALAQFLATLRLEMDVSASRVFVNGEEVTNLIRTAEVTALSRATADSPTVRRYLSGLQRQIAAGRNLVTEGRDQGTVVFPEAECKVFLIADPEERARRRHAEMQQAGRAASLEDVLRSQTERDQQDQERPIAPMVPAADAFIIDSTHLQATEVVDVLERHVRARL